MTDKPTPNQDEAWAQEQDASIARSQKKRAADRRLAAIIVVVAIAIAALYPALIGIGPSGAKSFRAESVHLWVDNTTEKTAHVDTAYRARLAHVHDLQIAPIGTNPLFVKAGAGGLNIVAGDVTDKGRFALSSDAFITLGDSACYAVFGVADI